MFLYKRLENMFFVSFKIIFFIFLSYFNAIFFVLIKT